MRSLYLEEKVEDFLPAKVLDCADDCAKDLTGKTVVIHAFGREEVTVKGKKDILLLVKVI